MAETSMYTGIDTNSCKIKCSTGVENLVCRPIYITDSNNSTEGNELWIKQPVVAGKFR